MLTPVPDIGQMARRTARRKEDHVDSHVVARFGEAVEQDSRRRRHSRKAPLVYGEVEIGAARASLHLDKGQHGAAPGDQVHLPRGRAHAAADDLPALEAQPPAGDAFRLPPALFGGQPGARRLRPHALSSRARS